MKRYGVAGFAAVVAIGAAGCAETPPWDANPFVHAVYFKFKSGANDAAIADMLRDVQQLLAPIPTVKGLWAGRPAPTGNMPFVDGNYDVGLLVTFADQKGLHEYNDHPRHVEFANKYKSLVDVRVFDFSPAGDVRP
ncbi:MAG TPA: Dabb family protein [Planctomycetota bacterium]|jgi:hypothetical protein|nr:Dabb family protein [Planctomycetota bacterium]